MSKPEDAHEATQRQTLGDQVYADIQAAIAHGSLSRGERVTERGLAQRFGVSATPVREALRRLSQDGLIDQRGPRTLHIAQLTRSTLQEVDEIEAELQGLLAGFAARKASRGDVDELRSILDAADIDYAELRRSLDEEGVVDELRADRLFRLIRDYHAAIERIADNHVLDRLLEQTAAFSPDERTRASRDRDRQAMEGVGARYPDHRRILDAISAGDALRASELARQHALSAHREIRRTL